MFEGLTKYIPDLEKGEKAKRSISKLEDAVYVFDHNHSECGLKYYRDILKSQGVNVENMSLGEVDVSGLSWLGVMALLYATAQEERRSCGALEARYKDGSLLRWLERLKEIDDNR